MSGAHERNQRLAYTRSEGLEVVQVPDGYVVYDDSRAMVHYLNPAAAMVLEMCDICPDAASMARKMQEMFNLSAPPDADVDLCLYHLIDKGLLERF